MTDGGFDCVNKLEGVCAAVDVFIVLDLEAFVIDEGDEGGEVEAVANPLGRNGPSIKLFRLYGEEEPD